MKKIISLVLATIIILSLPVNKALASNDSVQVTIPTFKVTVNEKAVNNTEMKYPMVVYKDITYFPLTWGWGKELGLASSYTKEDGLYIANYSQEVPGDIVHEKGYQKAGSKHRAVIPTYPVYINGKKIDNSKEEYPLLNFRNITYFPLTWSYVVDEFAWDKSWSNTSGLKMSSHGSLKEHEPGSHYDEVSSYIVEDYKDYAVIEKLIEERSISSEPDQYGNYSNNYEDRSYEYYKLDYSTNKLMEIQSKETADKPYNSGASESEEVNELFTSEASILFFKESKLLDLSKDAGAGNSIDSIYGRKYSVNGMNIYGANVTFTQGSQSIPAPYTPSKYYVFIEKDDNSLNQLDSWPKDQVVSDVYSYGKEGAYISSKARSFGSGRHSNGRGVVFIINSDLSVRNLGEEWEDWNSVHALGTDEKGNLYLRNTWFPNFDNIGAGSGTISTINDGYFKLDLNGKLKKIYPFIHGKGEVVTPSGKVYVDLNWKNSILDLESGREIKLD